MVFVSLATESCACDNRASTADPKQVAGQFRNAAACNVTVSYTNYSVFKVLVT